VVDELVIADEVDWYMKKRVRLVVLWILECVKSMLGEDSPFLRL
jgi:hypothetical protein